MQRAPGPTQEEMDDIEDNKWRRKSYALAQHNALPVPMPLPVYPPPKLCPPSPAPLVIRPGRLRPRPPAAGYKPSSNYRPTKIAKSHLPAIPDRLPTLAEGGSTCPTPEMPQRKGGFLPVTHPVPPSLHLQRPVLTTFQTPPTAPHSPKISPSPSSPTIPPKNVESYPSQNSSSTNKQPAVYYSTTDAPHPSPTISDSQTSSPLPKKSPPALPTKPPPTHRSSRPGSRAKSQPQQKNGKGKQTPPSPRPSVPPPEIPTPSQRTQPPDHVNTTPGRIPPPEPQPPNEHMDHKISMRDPLSTLEDIPHFDQKGDELPSRDNEKLELAQTTTDDDSVPYRKTDFSLPQNLHYQEESEPSLQTSDPRTKQGLNEFRASSIPCDTELPMVMFKPEASQAKPSLPEDIPSTLPPSPVSQDFPPTPTSHHLPPTPPSLSRSPTPTSLVCPRTPTSIRAAPSWQPLFPLTPLNKTPRTTPQSETVTPSSLTPATTPRPLTNLTPTSSGPVYPPTPPSSVSHVGPESVTPASSFSSLNHGPYKTSMGEDEVHHEPGGAETATRLTYPAVLDAASLHSDKTPIPHSPPHVVEEANGVSKTPQEAQVYQTCKSRFWILAVFSCIAFLQTIVWGTFGPIAESALAAFPSWTASTIAAFPIWGPIIVVVFTIPMMWFTQKLGLRMGMLVCGLLLTLGTMMRCFTSQETPFTVLCHVSSIIFAFAACMILSLPAMVAATWFPPSERITATAVGALMCQLGGAGMYLSPLMVRYPSDNPTEEERQDIRGDIMVLMYTHFGAAALLLVAVVVYFPARPPTPPSASSAEKKTSFFTGVKGIVKNVQLMIVLGVYAFSFGVPVVWIGVLNLSLIQIGIYQEQAMGVAVTAVICSCIASFITARITDKMYGHLRVTVIVLLGLSSVFFLWFLLISTQVITPSLAQVYVAVAGGLCFEYATVPLLVEMAVEQGYPIPESVIGASLTFVFNVVSLVFLGLFQIPDNKHLWVSYVLLACVSLTILPLVFVKETHKRSDTDRKHIQKDT